MQEICGRSQLKFERAYLHDFWDEAIALTQLNHAETGGLPYEDFNPDKDKYLKIEEIGLIVSFTLRSAGKLVGYCLMFVSNHLHYKSKLWAVQDTLFVHKGHRGHGAAKFLMLVDEWLKKARVDVVVRQVSDKLDYSRTLKRLGYSSVETGYMRTFTWD